MNSFKSGLVAAMTLAATPAFAEQPAPVATQKLVEPKVQKFGKYNVLQCPLTDRFMDCIGRGNEAAAKLDAPVIVVLKVGDGYFVRQTNSMNDVETEGYPSDPPKDFKVQDFLLKP